MAEGKIKTPRILKEDYRKQNQILGTVEATFHYIFFKMFLTGVLLITIFTSRQQTGTCWITDRSSVILVLGRFSFNLISSFNIILKNWGHSINSMQILNGHLLYANYCSKH